VTANFEGIDLSIIGRTEEIIETLIFRNRAGVRIRKIKREIAFTQAIDITIKSINYTLSENFKAEPPIQFYGYATLVMQDSTTAAIPIVSPKQRLYYGFQPEAFRQWRHWIEFYQLYQLHRFNDISLSKLLINSQLPYVRERPQLSQSGWIELPIREVYIKLREDCQFELEFSQWQPIPFTDPINNVSVNGRSRQIDGSKDNGLPATGIQPSRKTPAAPFQGNPPTTSIEQAGVRGFDLKGNIEPPPPPLIYWVEFAYLSLANLQGAAFSQFQYIQTSLGADGLIVTPTINVSATSGLFSPCGTPTRFSTYQFIVNGVVVQTSNWKQNFTWNFVAKSGVSLPVALPSVTIPLGFCQ